MYIFDDAKIYLICYKELFEDNFNTKFINDKHIYLYNNINYNSVTKIFDINKSRKKSDKVFYNKLKTDLVLHDLKLDSCKIYTVDNK